MESDDVKTYELKEEDNIKIDVNEVVDDNEQPQADKKPLENENQLGGPKFDPPLYKQRYTNIRDILEQHNVKRMADFGSAEGKIIEFLKESQSIEEVNAVDISRDIIESAFFIAKPLTSDYLHPRSTPLTIRLWQGDVTKCDKRFANLDSITMVEVIEHLEPHVLEQLPTNLFGQLAPPLVVITTPNAEFNILFPGFSGFRHWDHKFEWSRQEFQDWCNKQAETFGYSVEYSGIGDPPSENEHLGHCSQVAVFHRKTSANHAEDLQDSPYNLVNEFIHPYKEPLPLEENILQEAGFYIRNVALDIRKRCREQYEDDLSVSEYGEREDGDGIWVSLDSLMCFQKLQNLCDKAKLIEVLSNSDNILSDDGQFVITQLESSSEVGLYDYGDEYDDDDDYDNPDVASEYSMDQASEHWSDAWEDSSSAAEEKPWNKPENWELPLEVAVPELFKKQEEVKVRAYAQGFHQSGRVITTSMVGKMSDRFVKCYQWCFRTARTIDGQFESVDDCVNAADSSNGAIVDGVDKLTEQISDIDLTFVPFAEKPGFADTWEKPECIREHVDGQFSD